MTKRIEMYTIDDYCKMNFVERYEICLKTNPKYVYVMKTYDDEDYDYGSFVGVEYDDNTFSIIGMSMDMFCSRNKMIEMLFEEF